MIQGKNGESQIAPAATDGFLTKLFAKDPIRERQLDIQKTRLDLEEFGSTIADLNRKIEKMEKIANKWKERGEAIDRQA
ncbi:MAG: hypothetical protein JNM27_14275 [Leptospirales bacterium]|nr:hypothetical protein [Leptospirales bacterium]